MRRCWRLLLPSCWRSRESARRWGAQRATALNGNSLLTEPRAGSWSFTATLPGTPRSSHERTDRAKRISNWHSSALAWPGGPHSIAVLVSVLLVRFECNRPTDDAFPGSPCGAPGVRQDRNNCWYADGSQHCHGLQRRQFDCHPEDQLGAGVLQGVSYG